MLHVISARCIARDLHTIAPEPLERTCWRRFAPFSAIIVIIILLCKLLSKCGSTSKCLSSSVPEIHFACCRDIEQPRTNTQPFLLSRCHPTELAIETRIKDSERHALPPHVPCRPEGQRGRGRQRNKIGEGQRGLWGTQPIAWWRGFASWLCCSHEQCCGIMQDN